MEEDEVKKLKIMSLYRHLPSQVVHNLQNSVHFFFENYAIKH